MLTLMLLIYGFRHLYWDIYMLLSLIVLRLKSMFIPKGENLLWATYIYIQKQYWFYCLVCLFYDCKHELAIINELYIMDDIKIYSLFTSPLNSLKSSSFPFHIIHQIIWTFHFSFFFNFLIIHPTELAYDNFNSWTTFVHLYLCDNSGSETVSWFPWNNFIYKIGC